MESTEKYYFLNRYELKYGLCFFPFKFQTERMSLDFTSLGDDFDRIFRLIFYFLSYFVTKIFISV